VGRIARFAASARVFLLEVDRGGEQEVGLASDVAIRHADGRPATAAELRPGQRVEVIGKRTGGGALVAERITLLAGP